MVVKKTQETVSEEAVWPFGKKNYVLFGIALVVIVLGYIFLGWGDDPNAPITLTVAPIVLIIGYGLIPFAIMVRGRKDATSPEPPESQ